MVDTYQAEPLKQRKSQNLTFLDYAKQSLFWGFLPLLAGLATFTVGRLGKQKIFPLDGSPTIFYSIYEKLFFKAAKHAAGVKIEISEVERLHPFNLIFSPEKRLQGTHDIWNFLKGFEIGLIPSIYHLWRNKEQERLDIVPVVDRLKNIENTKPTDDDLREENAALRKQIDFFVPTPEKKILSHELHHDGKVEMASERTK